MRVFHGFITGLAAMIIIAAAAYGVWGTYQAHRIAKEYEQQWSADVDEGYYTELDEEALPPEGIPARGELELNAWVAAYGEELLAVPNQDSVVLVPVFTENVRYEMRDKGVLTYGDEGLNFYPATMPCDGAGIVNLARVDLTAGEARVLYDRRVLVTFVGMGKTADFPVALVGVVTTDANGDDYLNCDDIAELDIVNIDTGNITRTGINFTAGHFSMRLTDGGEVIAVFDGVDLKDGAQIHKIDLATGAVMPITPPDILSEAKEALSE